MVQNGLPAIAATDITIANSSSVFLISQCVHWNNGGIPGDCDTSQFKIQDIDISNVKGHLTGDTLLSLKCSQRTPCSRIKLDNITVTNRKTGKRPGTVICENVQKPVGFVCQ
jgi:Glycosyl hydrolases family 28